MRTRLVGILAVLALVGAACSDDEDSTSSITTTTATGEDTATTGGEAAGGGQDARRIVLQQSDFPAGWTSTPAEPENEEDTDSRAAFEGCLDADLSEDQGSVESPDFAQGAALQASSTAEVVASDEIIEADWAVLQSDKLPACVQEHLEAELRREAEEGVRFSDLEAERVDYPAVGDGALAVRVTMTLTTEGQTVPLSTDLVFIRKGRAEILLSLTAVGEPFPSTLAANLGRALASRA